MAWRVARSLSETRSGCWVVFCSGITKPSTLRLLGGLRSGCDASLGETGERGFVGSDVGAFLCGGEELVAEGVRE